MAENATNMDSNTEQNLPSQSGCHPIEPETLEDVQVREVDENLSQNDENIEHRTQNETINIPLDENYTDIETHGRPKRTIKPTGKFIENRIQSDKNKLDKLWRNIVQFVSKLQNTPDSLDQIKYHTSEVRSQFHEYQTVTLAFVEFLVGLNDPYYQQDYETMRKLLENRSQYIQCAINEANERKTQLLLEISSSRHSQSSRASTMSSTTARALAKAEAAAALKKAQIQKVRSVRESQSALELQKQELALNQRKLEEKARMETLRLEEEAEIAVTKAQAIDEEFNLGGLETINLPNEDPGERTHQYVHSQSVKEYNIDGDRQPDVSNKRENVAHYEKELPTLDPSANMFTPQHPRTSSKRSS